MKDDAATRFDLPVRIKPASLNLDTPTRNQAETYDAPTTICGIPGESTAYSAPAPTQSDATQFSPLVIVDELPPAPSPWVSEPSTSTTKRRPKVQTKRRRTGLVQIVVGAVIAAGITSASAFGGLVWWAGQQAHQSQAPLVQAGAHNNQISSSLIKREPAPPPVPPTHPPALVDHGEENVAPGGDVLALKALEALRAGRIPEAILAYQTLALQSANARTYRLAASILERKLRRQKKAGEQSP